MLFAKLLGRLRGKRAPDGRTPQPTPVVNNITKPHRAPAVAPPADKESGGFDPYNSGSFKSGKPWDRINRR